MLFSSNSKLVVAATSFIIAVQSKDIYVSPSGIGSGSQASPFGSIQAAVNAASAGDIILLRAGTYKPTTNIQITKSGTSTSPITLRSYQEEKVILDGESLPGTPYALDQYLPNKERGILHIEKGNYWKFYNLELINGPDGIYARDASHNHYSSISTHDNYETGFQIQGASSNNTVTYLDSYRDRDPRKNGESANGFACKEGSGEGNSLRNARLWDNVDDGLDLFMFGSAVTMEEVYAWGNGFNPWGFDDFNGDGNGFKLGITDNPPANHVVRNCVAFGNAKKGFIDNGNPGELTVERNTAWDNGGVGFHFGSSTSGLVGNVAAVNVGASQVTLVASVKASGNSWQAGSWLNGSFESVDASVLQGPHGADHRVKASGFLVPVGKNIGATTRADV